MPYCVQAGVIAGAAPIVRFDKVPGYNAVNTIHRRPIIRIHSPREIIEDEDENKTV
jgi:hypothetical protein